MRTATILILSLLLCWGCCKEDTPARTGIAFTGITATDFQGVPIYVDSTDWNTHDIWLAQESNLFTHTYSTGCALPHNYVISAYPNPCEDVFALRLNKLPSTRFAMRIVNKNFQVLFTQDSITSSSLQINVASLGIHHDTVRVYYKFIEDSCEYRGHGDIAVM